MIHYANDTIHGTTGTDPPTTDIWGHWDIGVAETTHIWQSSRETEHTPNSTGTLDREVTYATTDQRTHMIHIEERATQRRQTNTATETPTA